MHHEDMDVKKQSGHYFLEIHVVTLVFNEKFRNIVKGFKEERQAKCDVARYCCRNEGKDLLKADFMHG